MIFITPVLTYDTTNRESFDELVNLKSEINTYATREPRIILVGTKIDQLFRRQVSNEEAEAFATKHGMSYIEVSAIKSYSHSIKNLISTTIQQAAAPLLKLKKDEKHEEIPTEAAIIDRVRAFDSIQQKNNLVTVWINKGQRLQDPQWKAIRDSALRTFLAEVSKLAPLEKDARLKEALNWPLFNAHRNTGLRAIGRTDAIVAITTAIKVNSKEAESARADLLEAKDVADAKTRVAAGTEGISHAYRGAVGIMKKGSQPEAIKNDSHPDGTNKDKFRP